MTMGNAEVLNPTRRTTPENLSAIKDALGEVAVNERDRVQSAFARGKERVVEAEHKFEGYVREKPIQSLLIAAGAGVALGWLLGRRR